MLVISDAEKTRACAPLSRKFPRRRRKSFLKQNTFLIISSSPPTTPPVLRGRIADAYTRKTTTTSLSEPRKPRSVRDCVRFRGALTSSRTKRTLDFVLIFIFYFFPKDWVPVRLTNGSVASRRDIDTNGKINCENR